MFWTIAIATQYSLYCRFANLATFMKGINLDIAVDVQSMLSLR